MEVTKDTITSLIGTTEGFSADAVKEYLARRAEAVNKLRDRHRKDNGIVDDPEIATERG